MALLMLTPIEIELAIMLFWTIKLRVIMENLMIMIELKKAKS